MMSPFQNLTSLTSLTFIIAISVFSYVVYCVFFHPLAKVPGPFAAKFTKLWLVYYTAKGRRKDLDPKLHRIYGPVVRTSPNTVLFSNPEYINPVYGAGHAFPKSRWYEVTQSDFSFDLNLLAETDMDKYRVQRRLFGPTYATANIKKHEGYISSDVAAFRARLLELTGKPIELQSNLELFTIDALSRITFSEPYGSIAAGTDWDHMKLIDGFWAIISPVGLMPWLTKAFLGFQSLMQSRMLGESSPSKLFDYCTKQLQKRSELHKKDSNANPECIFTDLLRLHDTHEQWGVGWAQGLALTDLGAGNDTVTWTLNTTIYQIAKDPKVQAKVYEEIKTAVEERALPPSPEDITYDAAVELKYLQACIQETMRMLPNISMPLERIVPHDKYPEGIVIDGYTLPAGTEIGIHPFVSARSKATFGPDADEFQPERWLEASKEQLYTMQKGDLSFGTQARRCPGQHLAWVIMSKMLTTLFRDFEVEVLNELDGKPGPGGHVWREHQFFTTKWTGLEVRLTERQS